MSGRSPPLYCTLTLIAMQGHQKRKEKKRKEKKRKEKKRCCCCFSHSAYWLPTRKNYFTQCLGTKCPAEWRHENEDMYSNLSRVLSTLSRVWKVILKLWVFWVEYGKSYSILDSSLSICPIPYSYSSRVWKVVLKLWVCWVEYGKLYSSFEYFESSMGSCTQALSILSRVWKVILDTRLIVEYLPDTVLILE